jgi:hypothetical protein
MTLKLKISCLRTIPNKKANEEGASPFHWQIHNQDGFHEVKATAMMVMIRMMVKAQAKNAMLFTMSATTGLW